MFSLAFYPRLRFLYIPLFNFRQTLYTDRPLQNGLHHLFCPGEVLPGVSLRSAQFRQTISFPTSNKSPSRNSKFLPILVLVDPENNLLRKAAFSTDPPHCKQIHVFPGIGETRRKKSWLVSSKKARLLNPLFIRHAKSNF